MHGVNPGTLGAVFRAIVFWLAIHGHQDMLDRHIDSFVVVHRCSVWWPAWHICFHRTPNA